MEKGYWATRAKIYKDQGAHEQTGSSEKGHKSEGAKRRAKIYKGQGAQEQRETSAKGHRSEGAKRQWVTRAKQKSRVRKMKSWTKGIHKDKGARGQKSIRPQWQKGKNTPEQSSKRALGNGASAKGHRSEEE